MKSRIAYIFLLLMTFVFPSVAQNSYIEYEYVDGTKERSTIDLDRIHFTYFQKEGSSFIIKEIFIANVFDSITPRDLARNVSRKQIFDMLRLYFKDGVPTGAAGPYSATSMGNSILYGYDVKLDKTDSKSGIMTAIFKSNKLPGYAYHNGKQISSISGRISYVRLKTIPSTILNDELKENLKPFYLDPTLLTGKSSGLYIKFISPSYDKNAKKANLNDLSIERVNVIKNLKQMGYTLTSQKGVFPLTYQNPNGNTIMMYETYIMVKVTE